MSNTIISSNYINDLRKFVNKEQDTQNHLVLDLWAQSPAKRVSEGVTCPNC